MLKNKIKIVFNSKHTIKQISNKYNIEYRPYTNSHES